MSSSSLRAGTRRIPSGPIGALVINVIFLVAWIVERPATGFSRSFIGEVFGVQAIVLFSWSMVMVTIVPGLESMYGGLNKQVQWHRYAATAGLVCFIVHGILTQEGATSSQLGKSLGSLAAIGLVLLIAWAFVTPASKAASWKGLLGWLARQPYDKWRFMHRFIGVFLIAAMVHGVMEGPSLSSSTTLQVMYLVVCAVGVVAYLYRELLMLRIRPRNEYEVVNVRHPDERTLVVSLAPRGRAVAHAPGQFSYVHFGRDAWNPHPFTIASAPGADQLEFAIRVSGDETHRLYETLAPGTPAIVSTAHGRFHYANGGNRQVWIAAGIGITPFLSWLRSLDGEFSKDVDLNVAAKNAAENTFAQELRDLAAAHPTLTVHTHYADDGEILTPQRIGEQVGSDRRDVAVYMCGPPPMMKAFETGLRDLGFTRRNIEWENFQGR